MAKQYSVTVNGNVYDVIVEEIGGAVSAPVAAPVAAPAAAPVAAPVAAPTQRQNVYGRAATPEKAAAHLM